MKKIYNIALGAMAFLAMATGCAKQDIVFDYEQPQFPTRPGLQLLEVVMPQGTTTDDQLYIVGEFNGGLDGALADSRWQLEKAANNDVKWGIYIDPASCQGGKTLADGYYFYSKSQLEERTLLGDLVLHYDSPAVGSRASITVYRWAEFFNKPQNPDEVQHDGHVIYVVDNTGWDALAMYAWGDAEAFGGWPGIQPTGTINIAGTTYKYFDTGEANAGLNLNLIFNNNNNGVQLPDFNVTLDQDFYLELTEAGVQPYDPNATVEHNGYAVFVYNNSSWEEVALYMWGDVNDLGGGWPGMQPTGTQTINGVPYIYFDLGEENAGLYEEHLILNNNGGGKQYDDVIIFKLDRDVYFELTDKGATEIDPDTFVPEVPDTPTEPSEPETPAEPQDYVIYVENTTGWANIFLYAWGDKEAFGGWPGAAPDGEKTIGSTTYTYWNIQGLGESENLIFNNNDGVQLADFNITFDHDSYLVASPSGVTEKELPTIYVEDQTGWASIYLYAWGDAEIFGGWPGAAPTGSKEVEGVTYKYWKTPYAGASVNLILNNNAGTQVDGPGVTVNGDLFFKASTTFTSK